MSSDDVMGVLTRHIEAAFQQPLDDLRQVAAAAGRVHPATGILHWYGLTAEAQTVVDRAENTLLATIGPAPGELTPPQMAIAHQVNTAVAARDGRAMVLRHLLDPNARQVWRGDRPQSRTISQASTALPPRPPANASRSTGR
ncbi:hypothetical protein [Streptomyces sp. NBC_01233]|uniref:hypothetical protein n=1 Tax=Streptomyces sp. NBC_01233 TaxID=2903787 RepID=UPI002E168444|nr:hypothetical protein OG332_37270 [Streptomyces sp. NBC_01233]